MAVPPNGQLLAINADESFLNNASKSSIMYISSGSHGRNLVSANIDITEVMSDIINMFVD